MPPTERLAASLSGQKLLEEPLAIRLLRIRLIGQADAYADDVLRIVPSCCETSRLKLRIIKPAPTSNISDSAISLTTRTLRNRWRCRPVLLLRELSFSSRAKAGRADCKAGARPKISPVANVTSTVNPSVQASK